MTQVEFEAWIEFYRRWPFDDRLRQAHDSGADALSKAFGIPVR